MDLDPPFYKAYETLFHKTVDKANNINNNNNNNNKEEVLQQLVMVEECELPLINLGRLELGEKEREECMTEIARASQEWGFFQVVNHGISGELLQKMKSEQEKVFKQSFDKKRQQEDKYLNFLSGTYRWGTPSATCLRQLAWSEAFHIPLNDTSATSASGLNYTLSFLAFDFCVLMNPMEIGKVDEADCSVAMSQLLHHMQWFRNIKLSFRDLVIHSTMEQFATTVSSLALKLAEILAEKLGHKSTFFQENCFPSTCYLRMNRYPPCPIPSEVFGLMPHTDSDFLTILHQDQVGGLQLIKDDEWIAVKPNPEALIINVGDLFQAWSNNVYKSVQHRVVTNSQEERFSIAYFLCPSYDTVIQSCREPSVYRKFSFGEYRRQVQEDVQKLGSKIGLPRFVV